jgi:hypothetical protein
MFVSSRDRFVNSKDLFITFDPINGININNHLILLINIVLELEERTFSHLFSCLFGLLSFHSVTPRLLH